MEKTTMIPVYHVICKSNQSYSSFLIVLNIHVRID